MPCIAAVKLSERYISDRFLPDKAIDLMDEAAAKLAYGSVTLYLKNWMRSHVT